LRELLARRARLLGAIGATAVAVVVALGIVVARDTETTRPRPAGAGPAGQPLVLEGRSPITGEAVGLRQFRGKPVVVTIWASWCPGCNAEAEALQRFVADHPEAGFLGIDFQDSRAAARDFYERYGWSFPSIFDPVGEIAYRLKLQGTPTTIFLDRRHREVTRLVGETDEAGLAEGLRVAAFQP
jgi:thiol-disulfide isomerase/thioredoxin